MLVFHDRSREQSLRSFARECLGNTSGRSSLEIDEWRHLLIQAGQLEQGYFDSLSPEEDRGKPATTVKGLTHEVARAFCGCFRCGADSSKRGLHESLSEIMASLERIQQFEDCRLTIKTPEGFAFYSLFPEQYCVSAERWAAERAFQPSKNVLVVGIRSIGTTLSAVVAATLNALGWKAERITVRPT